MYSLCVTLYIILFILDIIVKENPKYKDIVRVKFEENIYRAKVLDKLGNKYSVFLIDLGKNIDVFDSNIFELPNSLKNVTY